MQLITEYLMAVWEITAQMGPYLLAGFAMAGALSVWLDQKWVTEHLSGKGFAPIIKGALVGVPMPLCSCSVIPVTAGLRKAGAGRGATSAFLASTPQTGVDSILPTWTMLGGALTVMKIAAATLAGLVTGFFIEEFTKDPDDGPEEEAGEAPCCCKKKKACCEDADAPRSKPRQALRYGFWELPEELALSLITGIGIAALLTVTLPADFLGEHLGAGLLAYIAVTLAAVPLYVCSTGSIPIAATLIAGGLTPGAGLVFLIAGPATNAATIAALRQMLGWSATLIYLAVLIGTAWLFGYGLDILATETTIEAMHEHEQAISLTGHISAAVLFALMLVPKIVTRFSR